MRKSVSALLYTYQSFEQIKRTVLISVFGYHSVCKHRPTCSQFTIQQIQNDGTISGLWQGFWRIIRCF